jgi:pre-mRNA-splicing factor ATP-dependent RNA helicase DHX15/PRP43
MLNLFIRRPVDQSRARSQLLEERKLLPVHQASADLRGILAAQNVVIIVGETGSGKTTQVYYVLLHLARARSFLRRRFRSCCTKWVSPAREQWA